MFSASCANTIFMNQQLGLKQINLAQKREPCKQLSFLP
jgi:hypothetical protein